MNDPHSDALSRRQWLERMAGPTLAASLGVGLLESTAHAQPTVLSGRDDAMAGAKIYNIRDYGAKGDGSTLDTAAVQAAIDACHAGLGGTVLVPAGDFLVGTLELKSHITLQLASRGRLLGSGDPSHYRAGRGVPPSNGNVVLLSAAEAENVVIQGPGTIDGNGAKFFNGQGDMTGPGQNSSGGYFQRPHLLIFYRCKNIVVRDVFLTASAYHGVRILECEHARFENVRIHNRVNRNNDGFHFNSSRFVHVVNCDVVCQDDACALFGSNKFVTITNCTFSTRWSVFRFGGGEAENITVSNCVIYETYGCAIKLRCGAGSRMENITFSNLILHNVTGPISLGLDSKSRRPPGENEPPRAPGIVRNIAFNGIRAIVVSTGRQYADMGFPQAYRPGETRTCIALNGVRDEFLENISFSDVHVSYSGGGTEAEAAVRDVPQLAGEYYEIGVPPAYGLFARNVRGLTLNNVRLTVVEPDLRPAVVLDHVVDATFSGLCAQGNPAAESVLRFSATRDVLLTATRVLSPAAVALRLEGSENSAITLDGGDLAKAKIPVAYASGASEAAVKLRI